MFRYSNCGGFALKFRAANARRFIITGPTRTGSGAGLQKKTVTKPATKGDDKGGSGSWSSIFDASFVFNLFLVVGAMGAGYTLGKTTVMTAPPATLFPARSTTPYDLLVEYEKEDKERENKQYDMFRRCILRILESKGIEVDTKNGKNKFLYDQHYCNSDISDIMNDEDNLGDVFFGRDPKEWEGKKFVWYPESTEDVSTIMKYCDEFKVPVSTVSSQIDPNGLSFQIDMRRFEESKYAARNNEIRFGMNVSSAEMNETLKAHGFGGLAYGNLRPAELFFVHSGVKLSGFDGRLVGNKVDARSVDGIECVLPDGEVLALHNDDRLPDEYRLFQMLVPFQEQLCVVTRLFFNKDKSAARETNSDSGPTSLAVVASNDLSTLNEAVKEIQQRVAANREIALIDSDGCDRIVATYGPYRTFAAVKVDAKELAKLQKKFGHGSTDSLQFQYVDLSAIAPAYADDSSGCYFSDRVAEGEHVLLVRDDLNDEQSVIRTYHQTTPSAETQTVDTAEAATSDASIYRDFARKLKLAVDSHRILNRNSGIAIAVPAAPPSESGSK